MPEEVKPDHKVTSEAVIEKPGTGPHRPGSRAELIAGMQRSVQEQGAVPTIEALRLRGVDDGRIDDSVKRTITEGATRPGLDLAKTPKGLREVAENNAKRTNRYLKEGYDNLTDEDKTLLRQDVRKGLIKLWPEAADRFSKMDLKTRDKVIEDLLRNPQFRRQAQGLLEAVTDPSRTRPELPQDILDRVNATKEDLANKKAILDQREEEEGAAVLKAEEYAEGTEKAEKIEEITGREPDLQKQITENQNKLTAADNTVKDRETEYQTALGRRPKDDAEIATARTNLDRARTKQAEIKTRLEQAQSQIAERDRLLKEKQEAEAALKRAEQASEQANRDLNAAQERHSQALIQQDEKNIDINRHQQDVTREMEELMTAATVKHFEEMYAAAEAAQITLLEERGAKAATEAEKKAYEVLRSRWKTTERRGLLRREEQVTKKLQVNADMQRLLGPNGPEELMKALGITDPELLKNPQLQRDAVRTLLQEKLNAGGLKASEAEYIFNSKWGDGVIKEAFEANTALKAQLEDLQNQGLLQGTEWSNFKDLVQKHPVARNIILSIILAGAATALPLAPLLGGVMNLRPNPQSILASALR